MRLFYVSLFSLLSWLSLSEVACTSEYVLFESTQVSGGEPQPLSVDTVASCLEACRTNPSCLAFDFDNNWLLLPVRYRTAFP